MIIVVFMVYVNRTTKFGLFYTQKTKQMLVLIGGVSRSGKSALADSLQESLGDKCLALHQDEFVLPENDLPSVRDMHDWEVPESVDWKRWETSIGNALNQYEVVVAEGILAFLPAEIFVKAEVAIYMEIDFNTFFARRKVDLRWGIRPDWYYRHVWDAHFKYGLPPSDAQILRLDGTKTLEHNLEQALKLIQKSNEK